MLLVLTPVFAFLIYAAGSSVVRMYIPYEHRITSRRIWKFGSVIIAFLIPFGFIVSPDPLREKQKVEFKARMQKEYAAYWHKFSLFEDRLYLAKSESDPAISEMKALGHDFKLGPMHEGRRELALNDRCYYSWEDAKTIGGLEGAMPAALQRRWYVGRGYSKATEKENRSLYVRKDGRDELASDKEFSVSAKRNGSHIDVEIYSDYSLSGFANGVPGKEIYAKECLGEEAFHRYLGNITVNSRSQEPKGANTDLERAFTTLLTKEEREELDSIVTSQPCVVWIPVKHGKGAPTVTGAISPYITLRHI
jgi:hypothetical protein